MTIQSKILEKSRGKDVAFVSTATTGLHAQSDKLIAVAIAKDNGERDLLIRETPLDLLMPTSSIHLIDSTLMSNQGLPEESFREAVADALAGCVIFSYFPSFQQAFLGQIDILEPIYDLPVFVKAAESKMVFPDDLWDQDLSSVEFDLITKYHISRPRWKAFVDSHNLTPSTFGMIPAECNAEALLKAWDLLKG